MRFSLSLSFEIPSENSHNDSVASLYYINISDKMQANIPLFK